MSKWVASRGVFKLYRRTLTFLTSFSFGFLLVYVIISFYKNYFIIIIILFIYFHENYFYFFMFLDVPECSGLFRHVQECSMFRVLSTPVVRSP